MKILHYFLGFPPYRTGGLTKIALDLMLGQHEDNEVIALWPGRIKMFNTKVQIKKRNKCYDIDNYELINPLPVPLDEGIKNPILFMKKSDKNIYLDFLNEIKPDVIHIHTLMGLYSEFIDAAVQLNIKTIYTTHDYFGICPKATLFRNNMVCTFDDNCKNCIECNKNALSYRQIQLLQSPLYVKLKNFCLVKKLRAYHKNKIENLNNTEIQISENKLCDYINLRKYYIKILYKNDNINFNSKLTQEIYKKYVKNIKSSKVINITHKDIKKIEMNYAKNDIIKLIYLGTKKAYKGYYLIKDALDELWNDGNHNFKLYLFGHDIKSSPYMEVIKESYFTNELSEILCDKDLLLAPSLCYETFGLTVLEALANNVPVLISDCVGAKDIVGNGGLIIKSNDKDEIKKTISNLNHDKILELKSNIQNLKLPEWKEFLDNIYELYKL